MHRTQYVRNIRRQRVHERLSEAQHVAVPHAPAQDAAEDVASARVGGQHAVAYEGNGGARMVRDDLGGREERRWR